MARGKSTSKGTRTQSRSRAVSQSNAPTSPETNESEAGTGSSSFEQQVIAFAEQLGRVAGTVQARTEGWLDPRQLNEQITRVRDNATSLLRQISGQTDPQRVPSASARADLPAAVPSGSSPNDGARSRPANTRPRSGGAVDAPGKKHRKPTPNEPLRTVAADAGRIAKMKTANANRRRGRG